jgi:hypothetical protein
MAIDIGTAAIDRETSYGSSTRVAKGNPANATGTITSVEIWAEITMYAVEVATFFVVSGNNLSTNDSEAIGTVASGSKQTFSGLDMDVTAGDYLGVYYNAGYIEVDLADGLGYWYFAADQIPCENVEFGSNDVRTLSLYGKGEEIAPPAEGMPWNLAPRMAMMISSH